jgi:hypothetical protein
MRNTWRRAMERMRSCVSSFLNCNCQPRYGRAVATFGVIAIGAIMPIVFSPVLGATAWAQQARVTGTVTSADRTPIPGVTVRVAGSDSAAQTNAQGRYAIGAPAQGTLTFTLIGYRRADVPIGGRTTVDVTMERVAITLEQVVVTSGYQAEGQRRRRSRWPPRQ